MSDVSLTDHGKARARERLGVPKSAVSRTARLAWRRGRPLTEFRGDLRGYLEVLLREGTHHEKANIVLVYGHRVFLFANDVFITAWDIPHKYRRYLHVVGKKKKGKGGEEEEEWSVEAPEGDAVFDV